MEYMKKKNGSEVALFPEIHYYRIYILSVSNVLKSIQDGFLHGRKKRGIREMEYKVGVISGDGIGPEIVTEAKKVLDQIGKIYGHVFRYEEILMGGCSLTRRVSRSRMRRSLPRRLPMRC